MATAISLASKFQAILDELYKAASVTARMDAPTKPVDFGSANEVKIFKTSIVGMGTYSRSTGYPAGDVTGTWETVQLACERGRAFNIDRMDNEESLGMAFGTLAGEYMRLSVVPEVDAYRFHKISQTASIQSATPATLSTAANVIDAVDVAAAALDDESVPTEGRLLYIVTACYRLLNKALTRTYQNDAEVNRKLSRLDDMTIIPVPQARFYTKIDLNAGATSDVGGFIKNVATGKDINFILLHPSAVLQATKLNSLKIFEPDVNQTSDGYLVQHRLYHDAWVYDNKVKGIYLHNKA